MYSCPNRILGDSHEDLHAVSTRVSINNTLLPLGSPSMDLATGLLFGHEIPAVVGSVILYILLAFP